MTDNRQHSLKFAGSPDLINALVKTVKRLNKKPNFDFSFAKVIVNGNAQLTVTAPNAEDFLALGVESLRELRHVNIFEKAGIPIRLEDED